MEKTTRISCLPTIIGCLLVQLCVGILYVWSVLKSPTVTYYNWSVESANMVSSYMIFAFALGNLLGGSLQDHFGPKKIAVLGCILFCSGIFLSSLLTAQTISWLYLTYCVLGGLGCGSAYGCVLACMQKWFPHRRGFASGLAVCAFGLSTVIFSPICQALINAFDVPSTFRILSITFFVVSMVSCIFIRTPSEAYLQALPSVQDQVNVKMNKDYTLREAIITFPFWALFFASFLINGTWNILLPQIKDLGMARGLSENLAVLTVSLTGVTNAAGRLVMASLSDKIKRHISMIIVSIMTVFGALCAIFAANYFYIIIILFLAFAFGSPASIMPAISSDLFGLKYFGTNYGVIVLSTGFSSVTYNALSNYLTPLTGSLAPALIIAAISAAIPSILMLLIRRWQLKH